MEAVLCGAAEATILTVTDPLSSETVYNFRLKLMEMAVKKQ